MWGRGQRNKVMKYGEGSQRVRCPWAPNVLATPLVCVCGGGGVCECVNELCVKVTGCEGVCAGCV